MGNQEKKKSKIGCLIKILLIIIFILSLIFIGTYIFYKLTKEEVKKYIPADYTGYIQIDSLMDVYNNLLGLRASDIILSRKELKDVYKTLLDIRSTKIFKNKILLKLLNFKINIVFKKDYSPILLLDLGYKSILTRSSQLLADYMGDHKTFKLEKLKNSSNYNIYKLFLKTYNRVLYISVCKNLLFVSFNKEDIEYLYNTKDEEKSIDNDENFKYIKNKLKNYGMADIYFNTDTLFQPVFSSSYKLKRIYDKFKFNNNTAISLNISNENILLNTYTNYETDDKKINDFIWNEQGILDVVEYLPNDTNLYSAVKIRSFEEFYKVFLYLQEGEYDETIKLIDKSSRLVFGFGIEELLFSWIGSEVGAYYSNISSSPVVFVKIKDQNKLKTILNKITKSILLKEDKEITYSGVKLNKISIRDFLMPLIELFVKGLDAPYYKIVDDFIFLSMDPITLVNLEKKYKDRAALNSDQAYKDISSKIKDKANIFLYFNMEEKIPNFLKFNSVIPELLRLYEKGALALSFDNTSLEINIAASGVNIRKIKNFPGYPLEIENNITSQIISKNIIGSSVEEMIYITDDSNLFITDFNNHPIENFPVSFEGRSNNPPIIADLNNDGNLEIYIFTEEGYLHYFDIQGKEKIPYPIKSDFKESFYPVYFNGSLIFYSNNEKRLFFFKNENFQKIGYEISNPILSQVTVYNNIIAFYPKSFRGTIYLIDGNGLLLTGWPKDAGSIGYGSPTINRIGGDYTGSVIFITQKGELNVWSLDGEPRNEFPLKISGVFYTQPVAGNVDKNADREIITLDKDGNINIISSEGKFLLNKNIKEAASKDSKILLFDTNNDKINELFIYGGSNNVIALNGKLDMLPGFPVKGSSMPTFTDFDSDGQYEMIVTGADKKIYVYTIPD